MGVTPQREQYPFKLFERRVPASPQGSGLLFMGLLCDCFIRARKVCRVKKLPVHVSSYPPTIRLPPPHSFHSRHVMVHRPRRAQIRLLGTHNLDPALVRVKISLVLLHC